MINPIWQQLSSNCILKICIPKPSKRSQQLCLKRGLHTSTPKECGNNHQCHDVQIFNDSHHKLIERERFHWSSTVETLFYLQKGVQEPHKWQTVGLDEMKKKTLPRSVIISTTKIPRRLWQLMDHNRGENITSPVQMIKWTMQFQLSRSPCIQIIAKQALFRKSLLLNYH